MDPILAERDPHLYQGHVHFVHTLDLFMIDSSDSSAIDKIILVHSNFEIQNT